MSELAASLRPTVMRLARRLRQMRDDSLELESNQLSAMATLVNGGPLRMGELAESEKVRPPSMTRIVDDLERRGYAVRNADPDDRRHCVVSITAAGREVVLANRRRRDTWLAQRLDELRPAERDILARAVSILDKVNHA